MNRTLEVIEEDNVVQIVADNAANYKVVGKMLMTKWKGYFGDIVLHNADLMLEGYEKKIPIHEETIPKDKTITTFILRTSLISLLQLFTKGGDLIRSSITRFATSYLTLECLHENRGVLIKILWTEKKLRMWFWIRIFFRNIMICLKDAISSSSG